jgi:hypothetical protein
MEDSTGIVDMFSQATKYVYMEWLYLPLIYLWPLETSGGTSGKVVVLLSKMFQNIFDMKCQK